MVLNHLAFTNWSKAPDVDIAFTVEAIRKELPAFCKAWGIPIPGIDYYSRDVALPSSEAVIVSAVDDDGFDHTAGYHAFIGGVPLFVYEASKGAWVAFHETFELLANPLLNRWDRAPDGTLWWREVCDATQSDLYPVDVEVFGEERRVWAANWLRPEFFGLIAHDSQFGLRYDKMGVVEAPFTLRPGGYTETIASDGVMVRMGAGAAVAASKRCSQLRLGMAAGKAVVRA